MNGRILIIPDVHGRTFGKKALDTGEYEKVIFLGDYVDPYEFEGINTTKAIANFKNILSLKITNPDKVVLLLGNHDMGYLSDYYQALAGSSRHDYENEEELQHLFRGWSRLFQLAYEETIGESRRTPRRPEEQQGPQRVLLPAASRFLFTHAGVTQTWFHQNSHVIINPSAENLNGLLSTDKGIETLGQVGRNRGGYYESGSMVWADVDELASSAPLPATYQIVGHSMQFAGPIITEHFACLDYRAAFSLDQKGEIKQVTEMSPFNEQFIV